MNKRCSFRRDNFRRRLVHEQEALIRRQNDRSDRRRAIDTDIERINHLAAPIPSISSFVPEETNNESCICESSPFIDKSKYAEVDADSFFNLANVSPVALENSPTVGNDRNYTGYIDNSHQIDMVQTALKSPKRMKFVPIGSKKSSNTWQEDQNACEKVMSPIVDTEERLPSFDPENIVLESTPSVASNVAPRRRVTTRRSPPPPRMTFVPLPKRTKSSKRKLEEEALSAETSGCQILQGEKSEMAADAEEELIVTATVEKQAITEPTAISTKKKKSKDPSQTKKRKKTQNVVILKDDPIAFKRFSEANLADVRVMKPGASATEIDALLHKLWDVATEEERLQWATESTVAAKTILREEEVCNDPAISVTTAMSISTRTRRNASATQVQDLFPPSPPGRRRRTVRRQKVQTQDEDLELSRKLDEALPDQSESTKTIKTPGNLLVALPTISDSMSSNEGKYVHEKNSEMKVEEPVGDSYDRAPIFKSSALMRLQNKEATVSSSALPSSMSAVDVEFEDEVVRKTKGKGAGKGRGKGKKENKGKTVESENVNMDKNTLIRGRISTSALSANSSLLNTSVSTIASVLSQSTSTVANGKEKPLFMVPKLKKKAAKK